MVTTGHTWLFTLKLIKIKQNLKASSSVALAKHFKCLVTTVQLMGTLVVSEDVVQRVLLYRWEMAIPIFFLIDILRKKRWKKILNLKKRGISYQVTRTR